MLHAIRPAALTGSTMSAATRRIPTTRIESATVTAASAATTMFSASDRHPGDPRALLVDDRAREGSIQERDHGEAGSAERGDHHEVATRHGEDRAEEVLEQVHVQLTRGRHEDDTERDTRVEDERERLVTRSAAARAEQLDRDAAEHRRDERGQDRRDAEEDARRDARKGDVSDPVSDERLAALHEEEAHGRRQHADDRAATSANRMNSS